jgi:DnaJ-class molecular chaperone
MLKENEMEKMVKCPTCGGSGWLILGAHESSCWDCDRKGVITKEKHEKMIMAEKDSKEKANR